MTTQDLWNENARLRSRVAELEAFKKRIEELFPTQVSLGPRHWSEKLAEEMHLEHVLRKKLG